MNVADGGLDRNRDEIKAGVAAGDILLFRGWFAGTRNVWVRGVCDEVMKDKKQRDGSNTEGGQQ